MYHTIVQKIWPRITIFQPNGLLADLWEFLSGVIPLPVAFKAIIDKLKPMD